MSSMVTAIIAAGINQSASKHGQRTFLYSAMRELVCSGQLWVRAALKADFLFSQKPIAAS